MSPTDGGRRTLGDRFPRRCTAGAFEDAVPAGDVASVESVLELKEVRDRVPGFDAALTAALWHESYLYEHRRDAPGLTPGVLIALERVGRGWISREIVTRLAVGRHDESPSSMSRTLAAAASAFARHVAEREEWLTECGTYEGSLAGNQPPSVRNRVLHQVAGLLCLLGAEAELRRYLHPALAEVVAAGLLDVDLNGLTLVASGSGMRSRPSTSSSPLSRPARSEGRCSPCRWR